MVELKLKPNIFLFYFIF